MPRHSRPPDRARERQPAARAAAEPAAAGAAGRAVDPAAPRQAAQRQVLQAVFGPVAVVQRVAAGRYTTIRKGTLRDVNRAALAAVPSGSVVDVDPQAPTSRFDLGHLFSKAKDHTWVRWNGQAGWMRDEVLGQALPVRVVPRLNPVPNVPTSTPVRSIMTPSQPIGMGGRGDRGGSAPASQVDMDELDDYRQATAATLEHPGVALGAKPLGMGRPFDKVDPADFRVTMRGGLLYDKTGQRPLTVPKSPFVLSTDGQLFGGQGDSGRRDLGLEGMRHMTMESHGQAEVGDPAWAGELKLKNGRVEYVNNQSGTYMLSDKANINLIKFLYRAGVLQDHEIGDLHVERVYKPGVDRDGKLERHNVLKN